MTFAEKDGMKLACVVMRTESPSQWTDSIKLFNFAFDNFQLYNVADNETKYDTSEAIEVGALNQNKAFVDLDRNACIVLPKTIAFSDATSEVIYGETDQNVVGTLAYTYAGNRLEARTLCAREWRYRALCSTMRSPLWRKKKRLCG